MRSLLCIVAMLGLIEAPYARDVSIGDAFIVSLPDSAKEQTRADHSYGLAETILQKYQDDSFQLHIYRWPTVKADLPLGRIPEHWMQGKAWASVSEIVESRTTSGIPYVAFKTKILRDGRQPFESMMTVLRSSSGEAYMLQMTGNPKTIDTIRDSVRHK